MEIALIPGEDTKEEITGPLVDYLRSKDPRLLRVYIMHYAYDRRNQSHRHNPWVLAWYDLRGAYLPAKMPLYVMRWQYKLPDETLKWYPVPPEPPAQGSLF